MSELTNFRGIKQNKINDCWIACAVMIWNYLKNKNITISSVRTKYEINEDIQGSAVDLLGMMYGLQTKEEYEKFLPSDKYAIPQICEINDEIKKKRPVLCCIGKNIPRTVPGSYEEKGDGRCIADLEAVDGHWIIIIGADNKSLIVVDPCDGKKRNVAYDKLCYLKEPYEKYYWQNSTYIDFD